MVRRTLILVGRSSASRPSREKDWRRLPGQCFGAEWYRQISRSGSEGHHGKTHHAILRPRRDRPRPGVSRAGPGPSTGGGSRDPGSNPLSRRDPGGRAPGARSTRAVRGRALRVALRHRPARHAGDSQPPAPAGVPGPQRRALATARGLSAGPPEPGDVGRQRAGHAAPGQSVDPAARRRQLLAAAACRLLVGRLSLRDRALDSADGCRRHPVDVSPASRSPQPTTASSSGLRKPVRWRISSTPSSRRSSSSSSSSDR